MPAPPKSRQAVVEQRLDVFLRDGYDGASLATIAAATGLGRSSLYHHFPGGKEEMVAAVHDHVDHWFSTNVIAPLLADAPLAIRIEAMLGAVDRFYRSGQRACLLERLTGSVEHDRFALRLRGTFEAWASALATTLVAEGTPATEARERAVTAIVLVEGALVVESLGEGGTFTRTLAAIRRTLV
jgi:TetR/AcrR family transcriptional repressor of lmrAB and yxaGH operons